ncbi:hypothetical protein MRX96_013618 [Rhipicephalus microplus]
MKSVPLPARSAQRKTHCERTGQEAAFERLASFEHCRRCLRRRISHTAASRVALEGGRRKKGKRVVARLAREAVVSAEMRP